MTQWTISRMVCFWKEATLLRARKWKWKNCWWKYFRGHNYYQLMEMEITTSVDKNVQMHFAQRTAEEERPKKEKAFWTDRTGETREMGSSLKFTHVICYPYENKAWWHLRSRSTLWWKLREHSQDKPAESGTSALYRERAQFGLKADHHGMYRGEAKKMPW